MLLRYTSAVLLGTVATFGLLVLMRSVIADPLPAEDAGFKGHIVDWARIVKEHDPIVDPPTPKRPPPPDEPPPPMPTIIGGGGSPIGLWEEPTAAGGRRRGLPQPLLERWRVPAHRPGKSDLPQKGTYPGHRGVRAVGIRRHGNGNGTRPRCAVRRPAGLLRALCGHCRVEVQVQAESSRRQTRRGFRRP